MRFSKLSTSTISLAFTLLVLAFINAIAFSIARYFEKKELADEAQDQLKVATFTIEENLRENSLALQRMAERWNQANGTSEKLWRSDALTHTRDLLGVIGIGYADANSVIKWIEPQDLNQAVVGFKLSSEERRREAISLAIQSQLPQMTRPIWLRQGGLGNLVIAPVFRKGRLDGFVYLVNRYGEYFPQLFKHQNFSFKISSGSETIFQSDIHSTHETREYRAQSISPVRHTADWNLEVYPTPERVEAYTWRFTTWTIMFSGVFSCIVLLCVWYIGKAKTLSNQVKEQNAWKNTILNSTELAVISTDLTGVVVSFNFAAERLLGYKASEVVGAHTPALWHDGQEILDRAAALSKEFGTNLAPQFEVFTHKAKLGLYDKSVWTLITKLGIRKPAFLSVHALRDEKCSIVGFVGLLEEVPDQVRLKEQVFAKEKAITKLVENTFDGFWDWDIKNDFEYISPGFWKMLGYDPKSKRHHPSEWQEVASPESLRLILANFKKHVESKGEYPYSQEVRYKHIDGHDVWAIRKGIVTDWDENGKPLRMIGVNTDITELKKKTDANEKARKEIIERDSKILELRSKSEEWFRVITTALPQLMWTCRADGPCDYLSDQWIKYTGIPEKDQLGFQWLRQLHPEDQQRVIDEWQRNVTKETVFSIKFRIRRFDGEYHWFDTMAIPIKDSSGRIVRWLGSNTDIQEIYSVKENLEDIKTRLEIALEGASIGIWDWDVIKDNLIWNEQMFAIYGLKKEEFSNSYQGWAKCVHPEDISRAKTDLEQALQGRHAFNTQFRIIKGNGEVAYVLGRAKVIRNEAGQPAKMIGVNWDITKIKLNEIALERARVLATESLAAKAQFLANMSHEIRTPINGIVGMTNLLSETALDSQQQEYVEHINQSSSILLSLINDILDLSKIESGKIEIESIDFSLEQIIDFVVSSLSFSASKKGIKLLGHYEGRRPHWLKGDPSRIRQVLLNLVGNAIKFTSDGSVTIRTKTLSCDKEKMKFRVEVIDTGIGISKEQVSKLFQSFSQADSSTHRKFGGTGLGLSISKHLMERLGGAIGVSSTVGVGSTFWIELELPLGKESLLPTDIPHIGSAKIGQSPARVLVAEDNLVNQKVASATLKKLGVDCQVVANGMEAIRLVEKVPFDLVLMDCQMPELDGYGATLKIRNSTDPRVRTIPIIAMTANAMSGDRERCLKVGMNDYVAKPFSATDLVRVLEKWIV